jgi:CHAT domain-containing protein
MANTQTGIKSGGIYYAYLLCNNEITLRYLGSGDIIEDELNSAYSKIVHKEHRKPLDANTELSELYKLLIAPFEGKLCGINHLYIAPDGELYKLPFEALRDEKGIALFDKFLVSYLSSGRGLIRWGNRGEPIANYTSAAILADPSYSVPSSDGVQKMTDDDNTNGKRSSQQSRITKKLDPFVPIPFARVQADVLDGIFTKSKDKRYQCNAKKSTLSEIGSPNIIHIVTHGFAHDKQEPPENPLKNTPLRSEVYSRMEDPMICCGLVFAGVNNWLNKEPEPFKEYGDGILNAKEALSLDLLGTDLLVLSACQTARGEVKNGDGIQGLRRSFELAGVHSMICTLWHVYDDISAILMERLYTNLIIENMDKLHALTNAKEYIKNMTYRQKIEYYTEKIKYYREEIEYYIEEMEGIEYYMETCFEKRLMSSKEKVAELNKRVDKLRRWIRFDWQFNEKPYEHPYYWAGYILQGDMGRPGKLA